MTENGISPGVEGTLVVRLFSVLVLVFDLGGLVTVNGISSFRNSVVAIAGKGVNTICKETARAHMRPQVNRWIKTVSLVLHNEKQFGSNKASVLSINCNASQLFVLSRSPALKLFEQTIIPPDGSVEATQKGRSIS